MVLADKAGTGRHTRVQAVIYSTGSPIQAVRYRQSDTGSPIQAVGYRHTGHGTGRQDMVLADKSEYRQIAPGTGRQSRVQVDMAGCMQT